MKKYKNEPIQLKGDDYRKTEEKFIDMFAPHPDVIAIYKVGSVTEFGISDIDFILVLKNLVTDHKINNRYWTGFDAKERYIMGHPPVIVNEFIMKNIHRIQPIFHLQCLAGREIDIETLNDRGQQGYLISLLIDEILLSQPRDFVILMLKETIDVRNALSRLKSLAYPVQLYQSITNRSNEKWNGVLETSMKLRKGWLQGLESRYAKLEQLVEQALDISLELVKNFSEYLANNEIISVQTNAEVCFCGNNCAIFVDNWSREESLSKMKRIYNKYNMVVSHLPLIFIEQFIIFASGNGILSDYLKKHLITGNYVGKSYIYNVFEHRRNLLNSYLAFITQNRLYCNFYKGFGYIPPFSWKGWLKNAFLRTQVYWNKHRLRALQFGRNGKD